MHLLLESSETSLPQFASISVLLDNYRGEALLTTVSPLCTVNQSSYETCLEELYEHVGVKIMMMRRRQRAQQQQTNKKLNGHGNQNSPEQSAASAEDSPRSYDSEDIWNDDKQDDRVEVFRSAHYGGGIALYYRVIHNDDMDTTTTVKQYTSMLLGNKAGRSNNITGILVCVGLSGWQQDSSLYVGQIQQIIGMMQSMTTQNSESSSQRALESVLQTLILTDQEERKTNAMVQAEKTSAAVSHAELETAADDSKSKKRTGKSKHHTSRHEQQESSAELHHVLETESSADTARITAERLAVLSLAENDVTLKPYEVSGHQRRSNFETEMAGKSRVRLRRRKSTTEDADLEDFDCPVVARTENTSAIPALKPPSQVRTTRSLGPEVYNPRAVPTLVAPRGDVAKITTRRSLPPHQASRPKQPEALDMFADANGPMSPNLQEARKATPPGGFSDNFGFEADAFALKPPSQLKITPANQTAVATGFDPFSPLDASPPRGATPKSVASAASSTLTTPSPPTQHAIDTHPGLSASASHVSGGFSEGDNWGSPPTSPQGKKSPSAALAAPMNVTPGDETPRMAVNVALNEDLTVSYRQSKISSCSIEGVVQVQVSLNTSNGVPFFLYVRDALKHIKLIQENRRYADDITQAAVDQDEVGADYKFTVSVPGSDKYFPIMRYKCNPDLRPVPMRVQTRVRLHDGVCRVALQISSNPTNQDELTDLTIVMGVPPEIKGETLTTSPAGGVWNESKRSVVWCVAELGGGEKFQLVAQFKMDAESFAAAEADKPKFPVLVRCQCMHSQLSAIELEVSDIPEIFPADVSMKLARRFRLSHRERS